MLRCALFVPAPLSTLSGGYGYDRAVLAGLHADGHAVEAIELPGRFPAADAPTRRTAAAALTRLAPEVLPIIDSLALPAFADCADTLLHQRVVGLIHHPNTLESDSSPAGQAIRSAEQCLLPRLARLVVPSPAVGELLTRQFAVAAERIRVVAPGSQPAPRSLGSGETTCHILSIGALVARKGHDVLMRALARLFDLDWHLTIVGSRRRDPAHAEALCTLATQLEIAPRVSFLGEISDAALAAQWQGADLFALASRWEGCGAAILEARRHGLPLALVGSGAAAGLVQPEFGICADPGDEATYSKSLRRLIFDRDLRHDLADASWSAAQSLPGWPAQCRAFAEALG